MPKNKDGGSEKLLTKGEVAQLCRVEVRTVDRWLIASATASHFSLGLGILRLNEPEKWC
jgi:hypothetical protein